MMWNNDWNGWGWAGWCLMAITMLVVLGGIIWVFVTATRGDTRRDETPRDQPNAEELLAQRLARGEITEADYQRQRDLIAHHH